MPPELRPPTIFAIPRAFERHIGIAQRNAIGSWLRLEPRPRVILLGDDPGTAEAADELGCDHIPDIACNEFGTPLLRSIFEQAHAATGGGLMLFVNSDIILTSGLSAVIASCPDAPFLLTGQRSHLIVREPIDFDDAGWEATLAGRVARGAGLGALNAMDYFLFPHGLFGTVPNFAIGRGWWDHWLAAEALRRGAMLIDATPSVLAVHQDHGFLATEEAVRNLALFGIGGSDVSLALATHTARDGKIRVRARPNPLFARPRRLAAGLLSGVARRLDPQRR